MKGEGGSDREFRWQAFQLKPARKLQLLDHAVEGDTLAVQGGNKKLLLFPLSELPEMERGRGVILQQYAKGGTLYQIRTFALAKGWPTGFARSDERENAPKHWLGKRAQAGLLPPKGFRFG